MLYIVPTPIGNLKDITFRAIDALTEADFIIAENPGHTRILLDHYKIDKKPIVQFAEHNELKSLEPLTQKLQTGNGCLVTDAGTPGISDPGFRLVRACIAANIPVESLPGASASLTALAASGLPTDRFLFVGFLPKTEPKVKRIVDLSLESESTVITYESPQRLLKTLKLLNTYYPSLHICIAREITKLHQEYLRGNAAELLSVLQKRTSIKGEITLLFSKK